MSEDYGRKSGLEQYLIIEKDDKDYITNKYMHAAHCMIYAKSNKQIQNIPVKAFVLMELRFDGYLGFPGGLISLKESRVKGLNRELLEEINWKSKVKESHHQCTYLDKLKRLVLHFYAIEIDEKELINIQKHSMCSKDHGLEGLGVMMVPVYTLSNGFGGFPCFLQNNFIGNAKLQLLETLRKSKIIDEEEYMELLAVKENT